MEHLLTADALISLLVLTIMEIVLGIDNLVFISILTGRLPPEQQPRARQLGLAGALVSRLVLLASISWIVHLEEPWFTLWRPWSGRDLVLVAGGLFLLWKATREIYDTVEFPEEEHEAAANAAAASFWGVVGQVAVLDIVFSLDSVITAVGMADHLEIMVAAVVTAVFVMLIFVDRISNFVDAHPSVKVLALSFLVLIGATLVMEGTGSHVEKGYIYSAMGFSLLVQILNLRREKRVPLR